MAIKLILCFALIIGSTFGTIYREDVENRPLRPNRPPRQQEQQRRDCRGTFRMFERSSGRFYKVKNLIFGAKIQIS